MKDLSIKRTCAGIGQTSIDLARCARFTTTPRERTIWVVRQGGATATLEKLVELVGLPSAGTGVLVNTLVNTLGGAALLGSTIFGLYGARQNAPRTGALGGALVGITATGCTILAAPILGGGTVGLTSGAALLGIGGTGGALVAFTTGVAAKPDKSSSKVVGRLMKAGGFLLEVGIAGGLFCDLPIIAAINSSIIVGLPNVVASEFIGRQIAVASQKAKSQDVQLIKMLNTEYRIKNRLDDIDLFKCYLRVKNILSVTNGIISYNDLLYKLVEEQASPEWFDILLKEPGIDPNLPNAHGETIAHFICREIFQFRHTPSENAIYFEYLKYLLADPRLDHQTTLDIIFTELSEPKQPLDYYAIFKVLLMFNDINAIKKQIDALPQNQQEVINPIIDVINNELNFRTKSATTDKVENDFNKEPGEPIINLQVENDVNEEPREPTTNLTPDNDIFVAIYDKFNHYLDTLYLFGVDI